ncbi:MAG: hypothetical protein JNK32_08805, partial [Anaerolineales bacterium]|nr:hypothetical protein [Anaerolineales bacterium]
MNELDKNKPIETLLEETAEQLQPNLMFKAELEERLRKAHKPRASFTLPGFNGLMPALTSLAVFGALVVFMIWLFQAVEPQIGVGSEDGFACPVTPPNGSLPPGESVESELYLGNGELWTALWPDGKVYMEAHNQEADGSFSMKWGFVRAVAGPLTVEGRRLDAEAEPLRAFINDSYGDSGLQILALIFPTTGCWEVTARVGESSLTFVTEVIFGETAPQPIENFDIVPTPLVDATETPQTVEPTAYSWRGMTLYLEATLPETPSQLKIFQTQNTAPATAEDARALAQQFNMNGDIYESPGNLPDTNVYLVVEGNRQLFVQSNMLYHYVTDQSAYLNNPSFGRYENAEAEINAFMQTYGLGSDYVIQYSELYNGYYALPRISNGYTLHLGYFSASGFLFRFTRDGLLGVEAGLVGYEELGDVSIISAEEAWQRILNSTDSMGMQEAMQYNDDENIQNWLRPHPLDETVTVFGWLSSTGKSIDGNPPLITLNAVPVTGNLEGIPENLPNTFVQAIGQFHEENDARTFILESWSLYDGIEEGIQGTITREGDVTSITILEGPTLLLPDVPDDLLLP